jgi:DNA polymerase II large subunit
MEKGVLRAKHGVTAFKDGTVRYDMTDLPVTAVRPAELDVTVDDLRGLGYETDVDGEPLRFDDQLVELKVQDVVLPDGAAEHMLKTADFVDDLLTELYDLAPFYEVDEREDLVGELVFGMAPHTSAAVVGRVVGFTSAAVGYAHPYFHAAKRRNCFDGATTVACVGGNGGRYETPIGELVEKHLDTVTASSDDFGGRTSEVKDEVEVVSATDGDDLVTRPVTHVTRRPAPDHAIRISTTDDRSLTVTPEHELLVAVTGSEQDRLAADASVAADGGGAVSLAHRAARDLRTGDTLVGLPESGEGTPGRSTVASTETFAYGADYVYDITVSGTHQFFADGLLAANCDGDEDCVMLLMDGLLNFSKQYLPDQRGGRMDAPLVMSSRIDPTEIDDEAHNMDIVAEYPRSFYEATREMADPEEVDVRIAESTLGTDDQYRGFDHTHDTSNLALGPDLSAYKTLGSMMEKTDAQLELGRRIRAVDETDVAERIIEYHFLPDLIGNLRAFSRQETRCLDCGEKYRRMPLTGDCRECGGRVNLTVHEGSVNKYMDTALEVAEAYDCREYTKQRLRILERSLERVFENDHNKASSLDDFM